MGKWLTPVEQYFFDNKDEVSKLLGLNYIRWDGRRTLGGRAGWKGWKFTDLVQMDESDSTASMICMVIIELVIQDMRQYKISAERWTIIPGAMGEPTRIAVI